MVDHKEVAEAAVAPENFNFVETVLDRGYPELTVPVYLDERLVQGFITVNQERAELEANLAGSSNPGSQKDAAARLEAIQEQFEAAVTALKAAEYTVTLRGISPEQSLKLEEMSYEKFPAEFEEAKSPVTGQITKTELPNDKRDEEFAMLIRQAHIISVTAPSGSVDKKWDDVEKVRALFARLPFVAAAKIDEAINNCTITVDYYRGLTDEVF